MFWIFLILKYTFTFVQFNQIKSYFNVPLHFHYLTTNIYNEVIKNNIGKNSLEYLSPKGNIQLKRKAVHTCTSGVT
jgi:hypothetical protein